MQEAILLGLGAFFYAVFVSVSSMATSVFFESQLGMIELVSFGEKFICAMLLDLWGTLCCTHQGLIGRVRLMVL